MTSLISALSLLILVLANGYFAVPILDDYTSAPFISFHQDHYANPAVNSWFAPVGETTESPFEMTTSSLSEENVSGAPGLFNDFFTTEKSSVEQREIEDLSFTTPESFTQVVEHHVRGVEDEGETAEDKDRRDLPIESSSVFMSSSVVPESFVKESTTTLSPPLQIDIFESSTKKYIGLLKDDKEHDENTENKLPKKPLKKPTEDQEHEEDAEDKLPKKPLKKPTEDEEHEGPEKKLPKKPLKKPTEDEEHEDPENKLPKKPMKKPTEDEEHEGPEKKLPKKPLKKPTEDEEHEEGVEKKLPKKPLKKPTEDKSSEESKVKSKDSSEEVVKAKPSKKIKDEQEDDTKDSTIPTAVFDQEALKDVSTISNGVMVLDESNDPIVTVIPEKFSKTNTENKKEQKPLNQGEESSHTEEKKSDN